MTPRMAAMCAAVSMLIALAGFRYVLGMVGSSEPATLSAPCADMLPEHVLLVGGRIDINAADTAAFEVLDGIGPKLAARVVAFRDDNGPFASVDELIRVPGIGPVKLARNRAYMMVGKP